MESKLILSKNSSENEIKRYFKAVLKLAQSDDEFPINLDEVWPLVYSEKGKAVRALTSNEQFIEGLITRRLPKMASKMKQAGEETIRLTINLPFHVWSSL